MVASGAVFGPGKRDVGRRSVRTRRGGSSALVSVLAASVLVTASREAVAQSAESAPASIAVGEWTLSPEAELRTRGEYRRDPPDMGGYDLRGRFRSRVRDAWSVAERVRLGVAADREAVRWKLTLQDARALGSAPSASLGALGTSADAGTFGVYEAFGELHGKGGRPAYVRVGRQAVVWGEGRLLGSADFSPTGRSLDAVRGHVATGRFDAEVLAALLEAPRPLGAPFGDTSGSTRSGVQLYGALGRWTAAPLLRVELYALARVSRSGADTDGSRFQAARLSGETYTGALRVSGENEGWDYGVEGAYQLGRSTSIALGSSTSIAAYAAAAHVEKRFPDAAWTPAFRIGGSYASGDDGGSTYRQFDPLLPDPQRFHGAMDLFAWSNLFDATARARVSPSRDTTLTLGYRYARLAETSGEWIGGYLGAVGRTTPSAAFVAAGFVPGTSTPDASLGHELDASVAWRPLVPLELRASWSGLLLGDAARAVMSAEARGATQPDGTVAAPKVAQYIYVQATLAFP